MAPEKKLTKAVRNKVSEIWGKQSPIGIDIQLSMPSVQAYACVNLRACLRNMDKRILTY